MERREQDDGRPNKCNTMLHLPTLDELGLDRMEASTCLCRATASRVSERVSPRRRVAHRRAQDPRAQVADVESEHIGDDLDAQRRTRLRFTTGDPGTRVRVASLEVADRDREQGTDKRELRRRCARRDQAVGRVVVADEIRDRAVADVTESCAAVVACSHPSIVPTRPLYRSETAGVRARSRA